MSDRIAKILSHDCGAFWQFVKYGTIGVMSTVVQAVVFYLLASTCLKCLGADDIAVRALGLPSASFDGTEAWYASRGAIASAATAVGFTVANVFCWLMNRKFVFKPGKFSGLAEFGLFYGVAALATLIALAAMKVLIDRFGVMTTIAAGVEVLVSFVINYVIRRFFIFRG